MNTPQAIKTIVIKSDNSANIFSWQTALFIAEQLRHTKIKIIHLCDEATKNGCSSVITTLDTDQLALANKFGIDELYLLKYCQGNHILGDTYQGWSTNQQNFSLITGDYGVNFNNVEFQHYVAKVTGTTLKEGSDNYYFDIEQCSIAALMAKHHKFVHPVADQKSILSTYHYQMNVETTSYIQALKPVLLKAGVLTVSSLPENINQKNCFYIDCSSVSKPQAKPKSALKKTSTLIKNSSEQVDSKTEKSNEIKICTPAMFKSTYIINDKSNSSCLSSQDNLNNNKHRYSANIINAFDLGWTKTSFLKSKIVVECYSENENDNEHIFSQFKLTSFFDDIYIEAHLNTPETLVLLKSTQLKKHISKHAWVNNHLVLGENSFSIEPLGINPLNTLHQDLQRWFKHFPQTVNDAHLANFYNQVTFQAKQSLVDFVQSHYYLSQWRKNNFWQSSPRLSEEAEHIFELFKESGVFPLYEEQLIPENHWIHFLLGFGYVPQHVDPLLQGISQEDVSRKLNNLTGQVKIFFNKIPTYQQYLSSNGL